MNRFRRNIQPYVDAELVQARAWELRGDAARAFAHLERAHVLGQDSTVLHVYVHWLMLGWAVRNVRVGEFFGQVFRLVGAATKTVFGLVPAGNTGGADVSPFQRMPVAPDLALPIHYARSGRQR